MKLSILIIKPCQTLHYRNHLIRIVQLATRNCLATSRGIYWKEALSFIYIDFGSFHFRGEAWWHIWGHPLFQMVSRGEIMCFTLFFSLSAVSFLFLVHFYWSVATFQIMLYLPSISSLRLETNKDIACPDNCWFFN